MRIPATPGGDRACPRRRTIIGLAILAGLLLLLVIVQAAAGFFTNFLWFHWSGFGEVWTDITLTKVVLSVVFVLLGFGVIFGCLTLVDIVVSRTLLLATDTELVRRYQAVVAPHALAIRIAVSVIVGLILGSGASSQWQHWLLFEHAVSFGKNDPVFNRDLSFFVFRLPFLSFLVDWIFGALVVAFIVTAVAYFLNGAIRLQGGVHVEPRAIAHLSLLLSLMALERAWAYYFVDRFDLDISHNGYVQGAGYTDVHVRLPAMELLAIVSLIAFMVLAFNVYQRTWTLPAIAVGLWALLALVLGVIFPALVQAIRVTPAQSTLESGYISRNLSATRDAMGISDVQVRTFPASQDLNPAVLDRYQQLLNDVQLWDPTLVQPTFVQLQDEYSYYELSNLAVDRYEIDGVEQPVVIGVRALETSGLKTQTWVNTHLEYTHGYGVVVAQSNQAQGSSSGEDPPFLVGNIPETVSASVPALSLKEPDVYFAPGDSQYVIVDSKIAEVAYPTQSGTVKHTEYKGGGGIPLSDPLTRLAFALHLHDFNLLISNDVTSSSRLIYIPDVRAAVEKALPFLAIDSNPYPVIDNGQLEWMIDGYTESDSYPYAENAQTSELSSSSGLQGTYNYVRDAVKVEMNAYTGKMTVYAMTNSDPILKAWEEVFPGLIKPKSAMPTTLRAHLRYPQDLLEVQAATYGLYHVTEASAFYQQQNPWQLSQTSTGAGGSPSTQLPLGSNGQVAPYTPIYEMTELAGDNAPVFRAVEPLIRYSSGKIQPLTSLMFADCDFNDYGTLSAYDTQSGSNTIDSPGLANLVISADPAVSQELTLLDSKGSSVTLGTVQILPIADSLLYVRPLYISSSQSQSTYPLLEDVIVLYGKQVSLGSNLDQALTGIFGAGVSQSSGSSSSGGTVPADARTDIAQAVTDYKNAERALSQGNLGTYQSDINAAGTELQLANELLVGSTSTTTRTAKPAASPSTKVSTIPTSTSDPNA